MKKLLSLCGLWVCMMLAGCNGTPSSDQPAPTATPFVIETILENAAQQIISTSTFRLEITQIGTPYIFSINIGTGTVEVFLRRAIGQFITPDELYATANVISGPIAINITLYAKADDQWFNPSGLIWINSPFATGFDPRLVVGEGSGFRAALSSLTELRYIGMDDLFGVPVYHIRGMADGADVSALLVGMIEFTGQLPLDVYIRQADGYPARLVITQPNTATADTPDTQWVVEIFDINAPKDFIAPTEE